jgi:hypothetical protein
MTYCQAAATSAVPLDSLETAALVRCNDRVESLLGRSRSSFPNALLFGIPANADLKRSAQAWPLARPVVCTEREVDAVSDALGYVGKESPIWLRDRLR